MVFVDWIFLFFSAMLIASALGVVAFRNPVHSALSLVMCFFSCSGLWLILQAEFLAIVLVLVYVGAVMVLFLFVIMMLDINIAVLREGFVRYLPFGLLIALLVLAQMIWVVNDFGLGGVFDGEALKQSVQHTADYSNTKELGRVLYTEYVLPFEIASVVLLVAIVAAIVLTHRRRPQTRYQTPGKQIQVKRDDRLKIIKMDVEAKD